MSLGEHLEDLRRRLTLALLGVGPIMLVSLYFGDTLLELLISPVRQALRDAGLPATLQQTSVLETFLTYFHIAVIVGLILGAPWIIYQLWKFVAPGLYQHERRFVYLLLPFSGLLSILGVAFMYFVILPVILAYFVNFGTSIGTHRAVTAEPPAGVVLPTFPVLPSDPPSPAQGQVWINSTTHELSVFIDQQVLRTELGRGAAINQQYRVAEWSDLFLDLCLAFAGGFQTPIIVMLLGWAGIIDRKFMRTYRRHAILIICVASAVLTPADPISMLLMSIPMYLLYELGGVLFTIVTPERVAYGMRGKPKDDDTPAPPGQGDGSFYREESPLGKKVRELVPNTLASAGLLPKGKDEDAPDR
jgi:sec-independent protein translocase protein TatC